MGKTVTLGTITDLAASPGDGEATLTWSDITGESGYQPRYSTTSGGPWTNFGAALNQNTTSVVVTGLTNGTLYYFTVEATDGTNTTVSNEASATPVGSYAVSFTGTVPLQTLSAGLSHAAPNNDRDVNFAATIPVQSLAAAVSSTVPNDDVSFAATVPLQVLAADVGFTGPNNDRSMSFSASVPIQALAASVGHTAPKDTVEFGAMAPMQALSAALAFEAAASTDRTATFSGTAPMQVLVATVDHAEPGFGVSFLGTVPVQVLSAGLLKLTHALAPAARVKVVSADTRSGGDDAEPRTITVRRP